MGQDTVFRNASDFIESNPHPAFTNVLKAGFELSYKMEAMSDGERRVAVRATWSGKSIGTAVFTESLESVESVWIDLQNISVEPAFKRRGVGEAMVVLAENILRTRLRIIWNDSEMSPEGRAFSEYMLRQDSSRCKLSFSRWTNCSGIE